MTRSHSLLLLVLVSLTFAPPTQPVRKTIRYYQPYAKE